MGAGYPASLAYLCQRYINHKISLPRKTSELSRHQITAGDQVSVFRLEIRWFVADFYASMPIHFALHRLSFALASRYLPRQAALNPLAGHCQS
jgi:hypothetical protein